MRRLIFLLPLLLFVGVGVAFFLGFERDPRDIPSALIDKPVPEFALPALAGHKEGLSTPMLKGDVTLVNVFASWGIPCKAEHPGITRLSKELGVTVRGINYKDKTEDAVDWLRRNGDPYASVGVDMDGRVSIDWGVYGVPETFLVDETGKIVYKHVGPFTPESVKNDLMPAVGKALRK